MIEILVDDIAGAQALGYGPLPLAVIAMRLLGATLFAAVIGFERERRDHPAGLRTNMMVGLAAACYAIIGLLLATGAQGTTPEERVQVDPLRLVEAVTGGVAFLAAGLIVFAGGRVRGLATGASMWLSAAAGLATGLGLWTIGLLAAIGGFLILTTVRTVERALGIRGKQHYREGERSEADR